MEEIPYLIGSSFATRKIEQELEYAAPSDCKVLLTGESGVGKEVVARLLHSRSHRSRMPLVTINCAGVPDTLLESELFGHERGSFTDAHRDKRGRLEGADGGTIFLDEVGEMSMRMQAVLLRFLESGEIQRIGSDRAASKVDVRIISATNRNLLDQIAARQFREDLYYRLNVIHLAIPPLRERREDIPELINHFLRHYSEIRGIDRPELGSEALAHLVSYDWPGNIRELKNVAQRLVVGSRDPEVSPFHLPSEIMRREEPKELRTQLQRVPSKPASLYDRMMRGESFWPVVYEPFTSHDITREDLRLIICQGLEQTRGSYKMLVQLFNMPAHDYRKFLAFLCKHQCHMPFQQFRNIAPQARSITAPPATRRA